MPFLFQIEDKDCVVGVWSMTESWEELACTIPLTSADAEKFEKITNAGRKREFLAVRRLLATMIPDRPEIIYSGEGKPLLRYQNRHISITHSRNLAAVILSDRPAGIDAEATGRNIAGIAHRYLSAAEITWTSETDDPALAQLFCWCCKESVYKMMQVKELDFKESIMVEPLVIGEWKNATAYFIRNDQSTEITLHYFFEGNNIITWCTLNQ